MFCPIKAAKSKKTHQPHTLQGASNGEQTFHKYPDLRAPGYYNLKNDPVSSYEQYEMERIELDFRPFQLKHFGTYVVTFNFVAREEHDLSVRPGEFVTLLNKDDEDWYWVRRDCDSSEGFVPARFICDYEQVKSIMNKGNSTATMKSSNLNELHTYMNHGPYRGVRQSLPTDQQSSVFQHIFGIPHSLQGTSSGEQTFHKYPDLRAPGYYNLKNDPVSSYEQYEMERIELDFRPFQLKHFGTYVVTFNFVAREEHDLSVRPGEFVTLLNKDDEDWYWVRRDCDSSEGFVPARFICDYEQVKSIMNKGNSTATMKSSNLNDLHTYMNHGPYRGVRQSLPTDQQSSIFQHI